MMYVSSLQQLLRWLMRVYCSDTPQEFAGVGDLPPPEDHSDTIREAISEDPPPGPSDSHHMDATPTLVTIPAALMLCVTLPTIVNS